MIQITHTRPHVLITCSKSTGSYDVRREYINKIVGPVQWKMWTINLICSQQSKLVVKSLRRDNYTTQNSMVTALLHLRVELSNAKE